MVGTGPAIAQGCLPSHGEVRVDCERGSEEVNRDLTRYAARWLKLQQIEVESPYGPRSEADHAAIEEVTRNGSCIRDVSLRRGDHCIVATWPGPGGWKIGDDATVVISREHPQYDSVGMK